MELFDINKEDYVYLKDSNGNIDKSKKFRMSGFSISDKGIKLSLRESLLTVSGTDVKRDSAEVSSKEEFVKI